MALRWTSKNLSPICIDLGADTLKLLQIVYGEVPKVVAAASCVVPTDIRGEPEALVSFWKESVRRLIREGRFKGKRVQLSVSSGHTYVRHVPVAATGQAGEAEALSQFAEVLPVDVEDMVVRYIPVEQTTPPEMICVAARRDVMFQPVGVMRDLNLEVVGIESESRSLLQAYRYLHDEALMPKGEAIFMLDIGVGLTKAMVMLDGQIVFLKNIATAGRHFLSQIAEDAGATLEEARGLRVTAIEDQLKGRTASARPDLPGVQSTHQAGRSVLTATAEEAVAPGAERLECLVDEVRLCFGYYQSMFPEKPIRRILFLGGESRDLNMCRYIAKTCGVDGDLGDPLALLDWSDCPDSSVVGFRRSACQPGWAVLAGLSQLQAGA